MSEDRPSAKIDLSSHGRRPPRHTGPVKQSPVPVHKFKIGQTLHFSPNIFEMAAPKGAYRVVGLLPAEAGDHQYRIQNLADGHERIAVESQLTAV